MPLLPSLALGNIQKVENMLNFQIPWGGLKILGPVKYTWKIFFPKLQACQWRVKAVIAVPTLSLTSKKQLSQDVLCLVVFFLTFL
jgi:hypothetical protein